MSTTSKGAESNSRRIRKSEMVSRARYDALVDRIEDLEDRIDMAGIERDAASREGKSSPDALPDELVGRLLDGAHPVDVWRAHRGYTLVRLEALSGVPASYISEIVNERKPGSAEALARLATALDVSLDDLTSWQDDSEAPKVAPLAFLAQPAKYERDTRRVRFFGMVKRDAVMVVASRETLEDLSGADRLDEKSSIRIAERNRERFRKIATRKYANHAFHPEGYILIGPDDLG